MNVIASKQQLRSGLIRWALVLIPIIVLLGLLSGTVAGSGPGNPWFAALTKPQIYPPPATFGIVWTLLYAMMGFALAVIITAFGARDRGTAIVAFCFQFALNLAWTPVFFAAHQIKGALILISVLDVAVLVTILLFWRVRPVAGALLLPYLAWICFATFLNWEFLKANPDMDGVPVSGAVQRIDLR